MQRPLFLRAGVLFAALSFSALQPGQAQDAPLRWGEVPPEDLDLVVYELDTAAAAVVLGDFGVINFDFAGGAFNYVLEHHRRIKILKRSGFSYGDVAISYRLEDEKISAVKAQAITPNGKVYPVAKSDIFEEAVSDKRGRVSFSFPQLEPGAVIEYQYKLTSSDYLSLRDWHFQEEIPVRYSEFRLNVPEWYDYAFISQGRPVDVSEVEARYEYIEPPGNLRYDGQGKPYSGRGLVKVRLGAYRIAMKEVPALKEEPFVTNMEDYVARLRCQLRAVHFPGMMPVAVLDDWPAVAKGLMEHQRFGQQFTKRRLQRKLLEELEPVLADAAGEAEKVRRAYDHLAQSLEWDERFRFLVEDDLEKCWTDRRGTSGELNLLLLAALRAMKVECYPLLVSTREHGQPLELYPIVNQFNHVVVAAFLQGQLQLLDLGNPFRPAGLPRPSTLNRRGWLLKPKNPEWIDLVPPVSKAMRIFNGTLDEDGNLHLKARERHEGYFAAQHREQIAEDQRGAFLQNQWRQRFPEAQVQAPSFDATEQNAAPLSISYEAELPGLAQAVGDFLYFNPILAPFFGENPFKLAERNFPIDLGYPIDLQSIYLLDLPEGYAIEELPESARVTLPDDGGRFDYMASETRPGQIQVVHKINLTQFRFLPEEYANIKQYFDIMLQRQGEQIVLKRNQ
jgi:hypothetical protein